MDKLSFLRYSESDVQSRPEEGGGKAEWREAVQSVPGEARLAGVVGAWSQVGRWTWRGLGGWTEGLRYTQGRGRSEEAGR